MVLNVLASRLPAFCYRPPNSSFRIHHHSSPIIQKGRLLPERRSGPTFFQVHQPKINGFFTSRFFSKINGDGDAFCADARRPESSRADYARCRSNRPNDAPASSRADARRASNRANDACASSRADDSCASSRRCDDGRRRDDRRRRDDGHPSNRGQKPAHRCRHKPPSKGCLFGRNRPPCRAKKQRKTEIAS